MKKEKTKFIFLDVDGVLNDNESLMWDVAIKPILVKRLRRLVESTDAKLVLSSSWRIGFDNKMVARGPLSRGLRDALAVEKLTLFDKTEELWNNKGRGDEILLFLKEHKCDSFVILDDEDHDIENIPELKGKLVKTFWSTGLTDVNVDDAIKILNQK